KRALLTIPVHAWILSNSSGTKAVSESTVRNHIDNANVIWARADIQFDLDWVRTWQSSKYFEVSGEDEFGDLENERWNRANMWIDIYYAKKALYAGVAGACSFPYPREVHAIVMDDSAGNSRLAHELGHYFNLEHTFLDDLPGTKSSGDGDSKNVMSYNRTTTISDIHLTVSQINRARRSLFSDRANMIAPVIAAALG
ncbi:MAG: hypothetical protein GY941_29665, partial [Planctomycetes bacterium]|nr:hypothetical protein [Planctomycetota bacterium]